VSRRRTCEWIGHKVANRFNAWLKEKQPPFSSHHQPTPPEFNAFSTPVRVPRSDYSPFMDGTFVYRHVSTGSLPVWVLVAREKWKGPFMWEGDCWWEETRGMIVMMDPQGHSVASSCYKNNLQLMSDRLWKVLRHMYLMRIFAPAQRIENSHDCTTRSNIKAHGSAAGPPPFGDHGPSRNSRSYPPDLPRP